ncbi:MAG: hypothetical protein ACLRIP_01000 [Blautia massiliensis (ex Durand et al. 2017)]
MIKKHIPVLVVGLLIVLVALAGGTVYGINKLIPSRKQMDLTEYYGQNADGEAALILGTEKLEEKALISGEDVYLPLDVVNGYLNQRYYWDSENKKILYATPSSLTEEPASDKADGNVWLKDDTVYLKLDYVKKVYRYRFLYRAGSCKDCDTVQIYQCGDRDHEERYRDPLPGRDQGADPFQTGEEYSSPADE